MIFRVVNDDRICQVKKLWDQCFEKSGTPFFEYYFDEYCLKDNTVIGGFDEEDNLLTMLHLNPYMLRIRGQEILTPYIAGVATDEKFRKRHLMGELLQMALQMLRSQNFPYVFLLPVAGEIYTPYSFSFVDCHPDIDYTKLHNMAGLEFENVIPEQTILAPLYAKYTKSKNAPVRTNFQWHKLLTVAQLEGTRCELMKEKGQITGYLLADQEDNVWKISELIYLGEQKTIMCCSAKTKPFMMARCIDARSALEHLPVLQCPDGKLTMLLTDDFLEDNNHLLDITVNEGHLSYHSSLNNEDISMDMGTFTQLCFGACPVLELVAAGKIKVRDAKKLSLSDKIFSQCDNYFNEYF